MNAKAVVVILLTLLGCAPKIYCQSLGVTGMVIDDDDSSPVYGAIVQLKGNSGKVIDYTFSSDDGSFSLKYDGTIKSPYLEIRQMGYRPVILGMDTLISPAIVRLIPEATVLEDVIVRAPMILQRSDTLSYNVSQYAQAQDNSISDVLKRLPGIEVESDGQIKYNGEPINKFYIDGSDFMGGRYGLATENISPADVASIDVLENHQPIQVLKGLDYSQQAGLNIKLKEEAKLKWIGLLNGGLGGSPLLYDASAFAMRIAGKFQNMETVRFNNTGWNPASQSRNQIDNSLFGSSYVDKIWPEYISAGNISSPLDEKRTRDNLSFLANTTSSWHIGNGYDMMLDLNYESDRLDYNTAYRTDYFDQDIPAFVELNAMQTKRRNLSGQLGLQANRQKFFIKNNLYFDVLSDDAISDIGGSSTLTQKSCRPVVSAANDLQIVRRIDNNLLTISSRNRYEYKPHSLNVDSDRPACQEVISGEYRTVTEVKYGWILGSWSIYARGGLDADWFDFDSQLTGIETNDPKSCKLDFTLINTWIAPEASWQSGRWMVTLSSPVGWHMHKTSNSSGSNSKNYFAVTPYLYGRFQISAKTDISAQLKYAFMPPSASMNIDGLIMKDFRNLYMGQPVYSNSSETSAAFSFRYRNPITALFANITAKYGVTALPYMQNQLFLGDKVLMTYTDTGNESHVLQLTGGVSKGLLYGKAVISLDIGYGQSEAETMRKNVVSPYILRSLIGKFGMKGNFIDWLDADYELTYSHNNMLVGSDDRSAYDLLNHQLDLTFSPDEKWQIKIGAEHYYTRFNSGKSTNLILLDASIKWLLSKRIEISLSGSNILNEKEYRYINYGLLSSTEYMLVIRGVNILASIQIKI